MGCICPPTSEKTCENPFCPRKGIKISASTASLTRVPDADCIRCNGRGEVEIAGSYFRGGPVTMQCICCTSQSLLREAESNG
jgi:hypothetical protein